MSDRDCNLYHWEHNCEPGVYIHVPDWVMFITLKYVQQVNVCGEFVGVF